MEIKVDFDVCEAHGECVVEAPEIFDLDDDDDVVKVLQAAPGEELREKAEKAARACPVNAIAIAG